MTQKQRTGVAREQQAEPAKLDAAIAACLPGRQANLKELGYGG
jgi:hypothetical protein